MSVLFYNQIIPNYYALKTIDTILYTRAVFEHTYYKYTKDFHYLTKDHINNTVMATLLFMVGYFFHIVLTTAWKSYQDWSIVEFVSICYFSFRMGYYLGPLTIIYLHNVSQGRFDHSKYNFEKLTPIPGNSYLNPIDLTMENTEQREAVEALLSFMKEPDEKEIKTE